MVFDSFIDAIAEKVALTEEEKLIIQSYLIPKKVRKKQYVLQKGDFCKYLIFVTKGALRAYSVDDNGNEHIIQFALEGWFIGDIHSMVTGTPAVYNIDVLEHSELVMITQSAQDELKLKVPQFATYSLLMITAAYAAMQKRITALISLTVDEQYKNFISQYPNINQRVPQHMIASYLGFTQETLSRVRKRIGSTK